MSTVPGRADAWTSLGTSVADQTSARAAMKKAGLADWDLRKVDLLAVDGDDTLHVEGKVGVVRTLDDGSSEALAVVGSGFQIIQNEEQADLLDTIASKSGAVFDTAGLMDDGKCVFITMRLPNTRMIGGVDQVDNFLAAVNRHDGTMAFHFMTTPVRLRCANMFNVALAKSSSSFRVRHSSQAHLHMQARAESTLLHSNVYLDEFYALAMAMHNTPMSAARFEEVIRGAFGHEPGAPTNTVTRCDNKIAAMMHLFVEAETNENIRGTVWAGFNAVTEFQDHYSHTRRRERSEALATKSIMEPKIKNRALALMAAEI